MGDLRVTIEHGGGSGKRWAVVVAVAVVIMAAGGGSQAASGALDALYWVAGVLAVAVGVATWAMIRATRHSRGRNYIRSVHGPTQRDHDIDEMARLRREIAETRARRLMIERARLVEAALGGDQEALMRDQAVIWSAEVVDPGHEVAS